MFVYADHQESMCHVCRAVVEEIENEIKKVDPRKTIEVGSYRIDATGDQKKKVPYAFSEMHLHEVLENVCTTMEDYAQAKYKDTGEKTIIKLAGANGMMNPEISKVDLLPDTELNAKLKFNCESIVDEYEDDIIRIFTKREGDPDIGLCAKTAGFCPDNTSEDEYDFEKEEL